MPPDFIWRLSKPNWFGIERYIGRSGKFRSKTGKGYKTVLAKATIHQLSFRLAAC